jgi:asparagine synthase (glutamine-hydrolysing)
MCGINGILGKFDLNQSRQCVESMNKKMAHRGPDADGVYQGGNITLGHRRLSIIDLDERGNQPMLSFDARYVIVFNGEIYNFQSLKREVADYPFISLTDTEVLVALFIKHGASMLQKLEGMFAIAIWDNQENRLFLARDRFGKKPIYYWRGEEQFAFSSEVRSLIASQLFTPKLNVELLPEFLQYQTVFDPFTLVKDVCQLGGGQYAFVQLNDSGAIQFDTFDYYVRGEVIVSDNKICSYQEAIRETRILFDGAVAKRLVSDVDFGAFLSGGVDSSAVVAVMSKYLQSPVKTFHVYFDESDFSELKYAEMVAKKFKTDHTNILITPESFLEEVSPALEAIDHPSADGVNTYVVSKYTRAAGIKMALSGLGGDEIFAGYDVFKRLAEIRKLRKFGLLQIWEKLPVSLRSSFIKKGKMAELMALPVVDEESAYALFRRFFSNAELKQFGIGNNHKTDWSIGLREDNLTSWIGNEEIERYMKPVLLRDTDQMSMAHSLEVRVPFLDHKLTDFVMSLPDQFKPHRPGKKLLIDAMGEDLPREIWDRKKMGFVFPWKSWVNAELKNTVDQGLVVVDEIPILRPMLAELRKSQRLSENVHWHQLWLLSTLGHWMKNNNIEA